MKEISVVVPVYNAEAYLRQTLDCLVNQTFRDVEILCVDDGSTDTSPAILREYAANDDRMTILTQRNQYAGAARNHGLSAAQGKYVIFCDADDLYEPDMLKKMHAQIEAQEADVCICLGGSYDGKTRSTKGYLLVNCEFIPRRETFRACELKQEAFRFVAGAPSNKLIRRSFMEKHHLQFSTLSSCEDVCCIYSAIALASKVTVLTDEVLYYYRTNAANGVHKRDHKVPLNVFISRKLLREKLVEEHVFDQYRLGFENEFVMQLCNVVHSDIENKANIIALYQWYQAEGAALCPIRINRLSMGVLFNYLITFEGVDSRRMDADAAYQQLLQNEQKYASARALRGKARFVLLMQLLARRSNHLSAAYHGGMLALQYAIRKTHTRRRPRLEADG